MRDHIRFLGGLFVGWSVVQLGAGLIAYVTREEGVQIPPVFWVVTFAAVALYGTTGLLLLRRDLRARVPAIVLSALALLSFPLGTALGIYGLWVMLKRRAATA